MSVISPIQKNHKEYVFADGQQRVDVHDVSTGRFMLKSVYEKIAGAIQKLTSVNQGILEKVSDHIENNRSGQSPLEKMDPLAKDAFLMQMKIVGLNCQDPIIRSVLNDMVPEYPGGIKAKPGPGYKSKIFDVAGRPVSQKWLEQNPDGMSIIKAGFSSMPFGRGALKVLTAAAEVREMPTAKPNAPAPNSRHVRPRPLMAP